VSQLPRRDAMDDTHRYRGLVRTSVTAGAALAIVATTRTAAVRRHARE
jgi:hypothetical protein